jgi:hypothetical protein
MQPSSQRTAAEIGFIATPADVENAVLGSRAHRWCFRMVTSLRLLAAPGSAYFNRMNGASKLDGAKQVGFYINVGSTHEQPRMQTRGM